MSPPTDKVYNCSMKKHYVLPKIAGDNKLSNPFQV